MNVINNSRFQYPDSGDDGFCLSPEIGNILTAARTAYGQTVATFNFNINVKAAEEYRKSSCNKG